MRRVGWMWSCGGVLTGVGREVSAAGTGDGREWTGEFGAGQGSDDVWGWKRLRGWEWEEVKVLRGSGLGWGFGWGGWLMEGEGGG